MKKYVLHFLRQIFFVLMVIGFTSVFVSCSGKTDLVPDAPETDDNSSILFWDSKNFDDQLSKHMRGKEEKITVSTVGISVDDIPERLDKWFAYIVEKDGEVKPVPESKLNTRSPLLAIALKIFVPYATKKFLDYQMYNPSEAYNAYLYYDPGDGELHRIEFLLRDE